MMVRFQPRADIDVAKVRTAAFAARQPLSVYVFTRPEAAFGLPGANVSN
jgi:hypothetical protein